jgi:hypothetical protein
MPGERKKDPMRSVVCIALSRSTDSLIRGLNLGRITERQLRTTIEWTAKVSSNIVGIKSLRILTYTRIPQSTVPSVPKMTRLQIVGYLLEGLGGRNRIHRCRARRGATLENTLQRLSIDSRHLCFAPRHRRRQRKSRQLHKIGRWVVEDRQQGWRNGAKGYSFAVDA